VEGGYHLAGLALEDKKGGENITIARGGVLEGFNITDGLSGFPYYFNNAGNLLPFRRTEGIFAESDISARVGTPLSPSLFMMDSLDHN